MRGYNRVQIIGNLGKKPEMRFTSSGRPVTSFTVAVNNKFTTPDGEKRDLVEWFNIVTWGKLAEVCNQFLDKAALVFVEGRQQTNKWTSEGDVKHEKVELHANTVVFLSVMRPVEPAEAEPEVKPEVSEDIIF